MKKQFKGFTGSTLKIVAIIAMFIDHFAAIFINAVVQSMYPEGIFQWSNDQIIEWSMSHPQVGLLVDLETFLRCIGRFGFPLFCFLLIEGFTHTSNLKKYIRNLAIFALVSEIPFNLAFHNTIWDRSYQNVFFTLLLGVIVIWGIDYSKKNLVIPEKLSFLAFPAAVILGAGIAFFIHTSFIGLFFVDTLFDLKYNLLTIACAVITLIVFIIKSKNFEAIDYSKFIMFTLFLVGGGVLAEVIASDYSSWGIITIVIMYLLKDSRVKGFAWGCFALCMLDPMEAFAFLMVPLVKRYNGKRGISLKYFFYAFYPVHIFLIWILAVAMHYISFTF